MARQAFAGMIWGKQFYCYDVKRWLEGDPTQPPPPPERRGGRNAALAQRGCPGHPVHAGPVGVSLVRRVGPGLPHGRLRAHRPSLREVPIARDVPRVVPEPERRPPGVRVVLRRRQPSGPRVGRLARVGHRRATGLGLPRAADAEAPDELHLVGQSDGPGGQSPVRWWLSRTGQHQRHRSVEPASGRSTRAGRRHQLDGVLLADPPRDGQDPGRSGTTRGPTSR